MVTTLLTPAENRFLQLSQPALQLPDLTRVMPLLREHPTVKTTSDFLPRSARDLLTDQRVDWLLQGSRVWKLLARLPYAINASEHRTDWTHCALCHKPVRYEYHVVLRTDGQEIVVGSECVKKFMSDEMQYLMAITTEDNFHAVAQYDDLTAHYPQVPEILWDQTALPNLPQAQHGRHRWVRRGTQTTVDGYLKHRQQRLPQAELTPYLTEYTQLTELDQKAARALARQQVQQDEVAKKRAEREAAAAWKSAATQESAAVQALRASQPYRDYLATVAALIVQHLPLTTFKARLAEIAQPRSLKKLVNSYQLGVMATEFDRSGKIAAARLQIVPRYLVADLNRRVRFRAKQRQRDWVDDLFNVAIGFALTPAERREQLQPLREPWEGRQVPAQVFIDCESLRAELEAGKSLPASWPTELTQAFTERLALQPQQGWVPARKNHVTPSQLRQLTAGKSDFTAVQTAYRRLYALPEADEAITLSALHQYYLRQRDREEQRQDTTQALLRELMK
ncbi:hypothetical protein IV54_GL000635 [Levilactobacillus paucivorans]|uniref:Uncharacterized protein n=1 Tax=Levilactobacillus paucivorans TaxID=616990 RepID=A0A0R2M015_9LACO|nr:hypothetical protein [Levilactobacillus paucivorans]KRO05008.1 hypothetical protein IV54_GL000635 [Levilactobacillus paucivorans]